MDHPIVPVGMLVLLAGVLSIELGISTAILEIIAGFIGANFFDISEPVWMDFLANLGVLGVMFFAGFETKLKVLKKHYMKSLKISLASYLTPLILTYIVAVHYLGLDTKPALLIAIGMSTTSLALVHPYLEEEGLLKLETAQILLSAAMIIDLLSMVSLSVLMTGFNTETILFFAAILLSLLVLPQAGQWLFCRYGEHKTEIELRFILLSLVGMAYLSEHMGMHPAIFAYIVGLVFSSSLVDDAEIEKKMKALVYGFFGPMFFFNSGYLVKMGSLTADSMKLMLLLTFIAFTGKYVGTRISVKKILDRGSRISSLFFNYRLSFGIIVAILGYEEGLIGEDLYLASMGTVILTSVIASIFLKVTPSETIYKKTGDKGKC